jgi:AAA+ ATPase superfamily predicted ATPase
MVAGFVGRTVELALLNRRLARVAANGDGTALVIRGRRQVGKSRLAQEFCNTAGVPYLFYTATKGASPVEAIGAFLAELAESSLPRDRALIPADQVSSWPDAFRALASVLLD